MSEKQNEQGKALTPDLREKRDAVKEVQSQLGELRKELSLRKKNAGKPDQPPEQDLRQSTVLTELQTAWSDAYLAHQKPGTLSSKGLEQWKTFEAAMGGKDATSGLTDILVKALIDASPEKQQDADAALRLEMENLRDEVNAGQKYIDTFPAAPLAERAVEQVDTLLSKLPQEAREFLRTIILDFLANFGESFNMLDFSGSIRFQEAMKEAEKDKAGLKKLDEADKAEFEKALVDSSVRQDLEGKWKLLHKAWANRKKAFVPVAPGQKFAESPPTIFDVYKKEEVKPTPVVPVAPTVAAAPGTATNAPAEPAKPADSEKPKEASTDKKS